MKPQYALALVIGVGLLAVAAVFVWCTGPKALAQVVFEEGGEGEGEKGGEGEGGVVIGEGAEEPCLDYDCTDSIIVTVSPDKTFVAAFSKQTGVWAKQEIKVAEGTEIDYQVASQLAVFRSGEKLYAFSVPKGTWHSIGLQPGEKVGISVMADMAFATSKNRMYAFGAPAGRWDVVEVPPAK
jgi:hypothetical protein